MAHGIGRLGYFLDMKMFGNSNSSKHASSRDMQSSGGGYGAYRDRTAGSRGYSRAEAEEYARRMESYNRAQEEKEYKNSRKGSGKKKKSRAAAVILIILAILAALVAAGAIWWKLSVKPPEKTTKRNNPIADLVKDGTTVNDDGEPITPDMQDQIESDRKEGVYTFLVLGMDDGNGNTDTIMAVTFNTEEYTLDIVSIPRDTLVNVSWAVKKANTLYSNYGKDGVKEAFADLLGYEVDFYVIVDIEAFVVLINDIGGVDYDVPVNMSYDDPYQNLSIHLNKGMQHLTGEQAIGVMRFRKGYSNADIGRISTQQDFLKTVAQQIIANKDKLSISTLANVFLKYVDTDLNYGNIIWLAKEFFKMDMEQMNFYTMPANYNDSVNGASYVTIYVNEWLEMLNEYLNPFKDPIVEADLDILTRNSSGALYATSGVKAGKSGWGSGSSSGGSSSSGNNSSSGTTTQTGGSTEPTGGETTTPNNTETTNPNGNDVVGEFDPENPIDEIPIDPPEVEPPVEPDPGYVDETTGEIYPGV